MYLLLTPECNLNCKYCFQRGDEAKGLDRTDYHLLHGTLAKKQMIDAFVQFCLKNKIEKVEMFGGEPLFYKDLFLYKVERLYNEVPNMSVGVITNGTLIDEQIMKFFESRQVSTLLSLDGERNYHNSMRGGFDQISKWFNRMVMLDKTTVAVQVFG